MDLVVGRVVKSHGIRGEMVVDVRTDDPDTRFAPGTKLRGRAPRGGGEQTYTVTAARNHSGRLLLSLNEIADRDSADAMRGVLFLIDTTDVSSGDDPDEFYDHELEGVDVVTVDGANVGAVESVLHLGASDLLSVRATDGREILIPFVAEIVPEVSTARIVIDPPDGLLNPEQW
ncbi:ribosome maturation factor RimM [Gordonia effusa NBRC 100432]|uniref:Ribosome maturation factor RimM n=1 Tax=Gordonia effusa NBRC 100432 TaxID=1077974 RepID=H0QZ14_9ACTN|nr:ribosome maturation factor RimM [Gordonia effusa]GAB18065.1 ribosome maturation factor RimM [Gordonia effusa NBRC 100432]